MSNLYKPKPIPLLTEEFDEDIDIALPGSLGEEDEAEIPLKPLRNKMAVLEAQKCLNWLCHIKPGASRIYHHGSLANDSLTNTHAALIGQFFQRASSLGLVMLVQKRVKEDSSDYYAYRTSKKLMPFHKYGLDAIIASFGQDNEK